MVVRRRRIGRPPIDPTGEGTRVSIRLSAITYDKLYARAKEDGIDVAAVVRQAIEQRLITDRRTATRL